jgi:hypothetical protein
MASVIAKYRLEHPEYREQERIKDNERKKDKYQNDPEFREKAIKRALDRYYKKKEEKALSN